MPERPDLEYIVPILSEQLTGQTIVSMEVRKPVVLRVMAIVRTDAAMPGRKITRVVRRANFICIALTGELEIVISPMLAGRFTMASFSEKTPRDTAVTLELQNLRALHYRDDVQMGKVYVIPRGRYDMVAGASKIGVDVLDPAAFTFPVFLKLARARRDQVKVFLMDKSALDSMGNAYADEVLFEAKIHPKAMVRAFSEEMLVGLHAAIVKVLGEARATIAERKPALDEKVRDFLKVRGRHGEPCPRCKATLRRTGVLGHDAIFCPECQPDERRSSIVDWRKI